MARVASVHRLARILALVPWVIQHPDEATVETVCERFGVDEPTLAEDINLIFMCGLPPFEPGDLIEAQIEGGMVVIRMADYLARPLRLTRWEAVSLLAAGRALKALSHLGEGEALSTGMRKLAAAVAPDEADAAAILAGQIAIQIDPPSPGVIEILRDAIERLETLKVEYYTFGRDALSEREIDPYLVYGSRRWYLVGHDHLSNERRTFRVDGIRSVAETGRSFERPADFDPAATAASPLYRPGPDDVTVVLELSPGASWVAEITPHDKAKPLGGGRTRLTLRTGSTAWLEHLLLTLGADATVVEPASLAASVRESAAAALKRYV